jgi:hypothetical protein
MLAWSLKQTFDVLRARPWAGVPHGDADAFSRFDDAGGDM